jgi:hypothetical protein
MEETATPATQEYDEAEKLKLRTSAREAYERIDEDVKGYMPMFRLAKTMDDIATIVNILPDDYLRNRSSLIHQLRFNVASTIRKLEIQGGDVDLVDVPFEDKSGLYKVSEKGREIIELYRNDAAKYKPFLQLCKTECDIHKLDVIADAFFESNHLLPATHLRTAMTIRFMEIAGAGYSSSRHHDGTSRRVVTLMYEL